MTQDIADAGNRLLSKHENFKSWDSRPSVISPGCQQHWQLPKEKKVKCSDDLSIEGPVIPLIGSWDTFIESPGNLYNYRAR